MSVLFQKTMMNPSFKLGGWEDFSKKQWNGVYSSKKQWRIFRLNWRIGMSVLFQKNNDESSL